MERIDELADAYLDTISIKHDAGCYQREQQILTAYKAGYNENGDHPRVLKRDLKTELTRFINSFEQSHKGDLHGVSIHEIVLYSAAKQWLAKQ